MPTSKLLHSRPAPPGASTQPLLPGRPAEKAVAQAASGPCTRIWLAPAIAHFALASASPSAPSQSFASRLLQILLWWKPSSEAAGLDHVLTELVAVPRYKMDIHSSLTLFPAAGLKQLAAASASPLAAVIAHVALPLLPDSSVAQLHLAFSVALWPKLPQLLQRCAVCPVPAILQGLDGLDNLRYTCRQPSAFLGG